jgi:hypothetical protein
MARAELVLFELYRSQTSDDQSRRFLAITNNSPCVPESEAGSKRIDRQELSLRAGPPIER